MKLLFFLIFTLINSSSSLSREKGQTEITTDEGIEVFQKEKYYLLKKNVNILSDNFELKADLVKAYFEKDLYDIIKIESEGSVILKSSKGIIAIGDKINFSTKNENINVYGNESSLVYNNINMFSDISIKVNNLNGEFNITGNKSNLKTDQIEIFGDIIRGSYKLVNNVNEIQSLYVEDKELSNIITENSNMFALKADYNNDIIELFESVKVIRGGEIITGDYAKINTITESYKIISNNKEKVKVLISNTNE
jgi:lipopolysaccharide export system protein LptA